MQIFVGNVPFSTGPTELAVLCVRYGLVIRAAIATDPHTGRPRGFACVDMPNRGEALAAIAALQGTLLGGRPLIVNAARTSEEREARAPRGV
jgi:cold-inducible RNA-binding protein